MTAINHLAGGTVFTGFFASIFMGINILSNPITLGVTIISSMLPDIDHIKSPIGKSVYPLARWINRKYGHRTITHGIPFMIVLTIIASAIETVFLNSSHYSTIIAIAYFSHLVFDMMTLQGVPLLYPFSKNPFVLIGSPENRIRSGDWKKEGVVFCIFIASGMFMQPLFEKGFWTTYNQSFATLTHLRSEFQKTEDALKVTYQIQQGLETKHGTGICIESTENDAWLIDSIGQWIHLNIETCRRSFPEHTGKKFIIETHTLINISPDSLNQILQNKTIQSIEIQGNQNFQITELNSFPKSSSRYKAEYLNSIPYFEVIPPNIQRDTFIADQSYKAQIEALQRQIRQIWRNDKSAVMKYQAVQDQIQNLKSQFKKTEDITLKQTLIEEIKELEKIKAPQKQGNKVEALKTEIRKIRRENRLKNEVKRQEIKSAIATSESNRQSTQILGFIKFVSWQN
jgi:inner membrane protein